MSNNEQKDPGMTAKASKKSTAKKATALSAKDKVVIGVMVVGGVGMAIAVLFNRVKALESAPAIKVSKVAADLRQAEAMAAYRRQEAEKASQMWEGDRQKVKEAEEKVKAENTYAKA